MTATPPIGRLGAALPFWLSLGLVPLSFFAGVHGGWTILLLPISTWYLFTGLDFVVGLNTENPDPTTPEDQLFWYRLITLLWVPVQLVTIFGLMIYVTGTSHLSLFEQWALFAGLGILSGTIGITYAHELMHQKPKGERWLADILLASVLYSHFRSEHLLAHHHYVGTPRDPVTARYNEGFHRFYPRVLRQCLVSAFQAEKTKLARKGLSWTDRSNPFWRYWALQGLMLALALLVAVASATQDVAIDAFRIESGGTRMQAAMAATYMMGYRIAMIAAGAGVLWLAAWVDPSEARYEHGPWQFAYGVMAALMVIGMLTTLLAHEPSPPASSDGEVDDALARMAERLPASRRWLLRIPLVRWLWRVMLSPFVDFFVRYGWLALLVLALIASYRLSDIVLGVIANVFSVDMGFSKTEVANVTKVFGVAMTLLCAFVGGVLFNRLGVMRILFAGALLSAATNLLFALLAKVGASVPMLIGVVAMDNLSGGLATAAFVAYLSALTNVQFSATQYALFSSLMVLLPKFLGGFSGVLVDSIGYEQFFTLTALMGLPVLVLVWLAARYTTLEVRDDDA